MITEPGLYPDMSEGDYHEDPCPAPSLSSSNAKVLIGQSPRHAWTAHPRLNPNYEPTIKDAYDLGSTVHTNTLGAGEIRVLEFKDYKTNAAKAERDAARADGATPILTHKWAEVEAMTKAFHAQLALTELRGILNAGKPEQTLVWREGDIWCRCRLDWLPLDLLGATAGNVFVDLKSTGGSAHPEDFQKQVFNLGYDIQWAFYRRGIAAVLGIPDPTFIFMVQETSPPYALSLATLGGHAQVIADHRVEHAIALWSWCLRNNAWPGYNRYPAHLDPPAWYAQRHEMDHHTRAAVGETEMLKQLVDWQAPLDWDDKGETTDAG